MNHFKRNRAENPQGLLFSEASGFNRRHFLKISGLLAGLSAAPAFLRSVRGDSLNANGSLFTLGVASGDPGQRSVMLWTRLAPDPLNGGGLDRRFVQVRWEVAEDFGMTRILRQGIALASQINGHAVSVLAGGLPLNRWLYYRFHALGQSSRVGRTRWCLSKTLRWQLMQLWSLKKVSIGQVAINV